MNTYPEHEKLAAVQAESQAIGEFVEWLGSKGLHLMEWRTDLTDQRSCLDLDCDDGKVRGKSCRRCDGTGLREVTGVEAWVPAPGSIEDLLAEHFGIDRGALEAEKRAILDSLRVASR